jgi:hypothetical protein
VRVLGGEATERAIEVTDPLDRVLGLEIDASFFFGDAAVFAFDLVFLAGGSGTASMLPTFWSSSGAVELFWLADSVAAWALCLDAGCVLNSFDCNMETSSIDSTLIFD